MIVVRSAYIWDRVLSKEERERTRRFTEYGEGTLPDGARAITLAEPLEPPQVTVAQVKAYRDKHGCSLTQARDDLLLGKK